MRTTAMLAALAITTSFSQGCSTTQPLWSAKSWEFSDLNRRPVPTDPVKLHDECAWLHSKAQAIEELLANSNISHPDESNLTLESEAKRRLLNLESRHDQIKCSAAPPLSATPD